MLFSIDDDSGTVVIGWLMPDNPSITPRVRVFIPDLEPKVISAQHYRPTLKQQNLHNTGICGFVLDELNCPGLANAKSLDIIDEDTGVLLYRRNPTESLIEAKLFRLETRLLRMSAIDQWLFPHFQMTYTGLEMRSEQTTGAILGIPFSKSIYASGRVQFKAFDYLLRDRGFKTAILLRNPYEELAERILALNVLNRPETATSASLFGRNVYNAIGVAKNANLSTIEGIEDVISRINDKSIPILCNTLARQLTAMAWDDPLDAAAVPSALDMLGDIDAVGIFTDMPMFVDVLSAVIGITEPMPEFELKIFDSVKKLTELLRQTPSAARLIEYDLEIYAAVLGAAQEV